MNAVEKTNVMRLLEQAGISYEAREYEVDEQDLSGSHAADVMGEDHDLRLQDPGAEGGADGLPGLLHPRGRGAGLEKSGQGRRRQEGGDASHEGPAGGHRLYPGRLFARGDEEEIPHLYRRDGRAVSTGSPSAPACGESRFWSLPRPWPRMWRAEFVPLLKE